MLPEPDVWARSREIPSSSADGYYERIARWLVDDPRTRGHSPFGSNRGLSIESTPSTPAPESLKLQKAP
jgi:hypothetical protein